ncbi:DUF3347 domain-containing protein [Flavobacterium difficile]|jgi:hypothetical protein|uniref:DUF3347 domain-containing protein n=1 Tax=Flavobacterium difficile TaxID=2709659 RepID=A0ABX0IA01_9FLAO|nr:DUF3347 domain-containing protein [Flavobacterium difficile]NHM02517.1 DUF3347 domain-containing protein [Flavobacterium difficile]
MKSLFLTAILAITLVSCNHKTKETENNTSVNSNEIFACPMHSEITGKKGEDCSKCGMELTVPVTQSENQNDGTQVDKDTVKQTSNETVEKVVETKTATTSFSINEIVTNYLKIKNALTKDDSNGASNAGKVLFKTLNVTSTNDLTSNQKKDYLKIVTEAKQNTEHIKNNSGKIEHQRERFELLSKNINDLIKMFGTKQKLYQDYCPMYNDGKGGVWISETKEIKNPYYGSEMLSCGTIKKSY